MKMIIKLLSLIICVNWLFSGCAPVARAVSAVMDKTKLVYLVVGFDDAAENTDVICTVGYDEADNSIRILQIPRDTYFDFGGSQNKINQLYATKYLEGNSRLDALRLTAKEIGKALGTEFDGFIGLNTGTFKELIDAVGGVTLELPTDMDVTLDGDENRTVLKKGSNHIDGYTAERFVRYRQGYVMGDLSRINAQKIFISALISKIKNDLTLPKIIEIASIFHKRVISDIPLSSGIDLSTSLMPRSDPKLVYATMPGEPVKNEHGLSFYVLNRKSAAEISERYVFSEKEFDADARFLNKNEISFLNVYYDKDFEAVEFFDDEISSIKIK